MGQPEQHPYPERDEKIRENVACPDCTANRGEFCRDVHGAEVPTHERRVTVYIRDYVEPFLDEQTVETAEVEDEQAEDDEPEVDDRA